MPNVSMTSSLHSQNGWQRTSRRNCFHDAAMAWIEPSLIVRFMGPTWGPTGADRTQVGAQVGPTGPRWAPCWPHELCYLWCFPALPSAISRNNAGNSSWTRLRQNLFGYRSCLNLHRIYNSRWPTRFRYHFRHFNGWSLRANKYFARLKHFYKA